MRVRALIWSYAEPEGQDYGATVAPHPERVRALLAPMSGAAEWLSCPRSAAAPDFAKTPLLLRGRGSGGHAKADAGESR